MEKTSNERAAELRREYHKQWRAKNKDKVREYNRRFWEKRAAQTTCAASADERAQ